MWRVPADLHSRAQMARRQPETGLLHAVIAAAVAVPA
jgi:hypothetical protein